MSEPRCRLLPNCEEIHHLTMKGMDQPLTWGERLRLRGHLAICATCTHFSGQMRMMREAMRRLGQDGGDGPGPRP